MGQKAKYTLHDLQSIASERGGALLSVEGLTTRSFGVWACDKHHEWTAKVNNVLNGGWCPACAVDKNKIWTEEAVRTDALRYTTLSDWILNSSSAYAISKRKGWFEAVSSHLIRESKQWTKEEIAEIAKKYNNKKDFMKGDHAAYVYCYRHNWFKDVCDHMHLLRKYDWTKEEALERAKLYNTRHSFSQKDSAAYTYAHRRGWLDEACAHMPDFIRSSGPELELSKWITSLGIFNEKYFFTTKGRGKKEIDIYIPSLNIGIEYCGLYWHSDLFTERQAHREKMIMANEKGIRLITLFEDEWLNRQDQVKSFLMSLLGKNNKINARDCELSEISTETARKFYDMYHIQGGRSAHVKSFGLFFNNELVGAISGGKHHRNGFDDSLVLDRLCFKSDISIVGGSSRLLKYLIEHAKSAGYSKVISWSDNRWSEGNVYKSLNFTMEEELSVEYSYCKGQKRYSKQSKKKKQLTKEGGTGNTEYEMALSLGYSRIWDCGKKRWVITLS